MLSSITVIIDKYKFNDNQEHIFPMMNDENRTQSLESIHSGFLQNVNRWLKELAKKFELEYRIMHLYL